jgi:hypothetical protein
MEISKRLIHSEMPVTDKTAQRVYDTSLIVIRTVGSKRGGLDDFLRAEVSRKRGQSEVSIGALTEEGKKHRPGQALVSFRDDRAGTDWMDVYEIHPQKEDASSVTLIKVLDEGENISRPATEGEGRTLLNHVGHLRKTRNLVAWGKDHSSELGMTGASVMLDGAAVSDFVNGDTSSGVVQGIAGVLLAGGAIYEVHRKKKTR